MSSGWIGPSPQPEFGPAKFGNLIIPSIGLFLHLANICLINERLDRSACFISNPLYSIILLTRLNICHQLPVVYGENVVGNE